VQIGGQVLSPARALAVGSAVVNNVAGATVAVNTPAVFRAGDIVTKSGTSRAEVVRIQGNNLTLAAALPALAVNNIIRIADLVPGQTTFRVSNPAGLGPGTTGFLIGDDATNPGSPFSQRVTIKAMDSIRGLVTLQPGDERSQSVNLAPGAATAPVFAPATPNAVITLEGISPQVINGLKLQASTDDGGRYIFDRLQGGRYRLSAAAAGSAGTPPQPREIDVPSSSGEYDLQFT
jgi:hypothetical protein